MSHVDLWEQMLLSTCGHEVHWLQVPSHIGICGNHKADELADVGRRKSPLLFGHISMNVVGRVTGGAPGADPLRRPPPPSLLGFGWKVPDHGRRRRPKEILLDLVKGEKMGFHPTCQY